MTMIKNKTNILTEWNKIKDYEIFDSFEEFEKLYNSKPNGICMRKYTVYPWCKENFFFGTAEELQDFYKTTTEIPFYLNEKIGKKYYSLTILKFYRDEDNIIYATCRCDCGNIVEKKWKSVADGNGRSCGCRNRKSKQTVEVVDDIRDIMPETINKFWDFKENRCNPENISLHTSQKYYWKNSKGVRFHLAPLELTNHLPSTSLMEQTILYYVKKFYPGAQSRARLSSAEADIFIPELNLAIEYDGLYYHRDKVDNDNRRNKIINESGVYLLCIRDLSLPILDKYYGETLLFAEKALSIEEQANLVFQILKLIFDFHKTTTIALPKGFQDYIENDCLTVEQLEEDQNCGIFAQFHLFEKNSVDYFIYSIETGKDIKYFPNIETVSNYLYALISYKLIRGTLNVEDINTIQERYCYIEGEYENLINRLLLEIKKDKEKTNHLISIIKSKEIGSVFSSEGWSFGIVCWTNKRYVYYCNINSLLKEYSVSDQKQQERIFKSLVKHLQSHNEFQLIDLRHINDAEKNIFLFKRFGLNRFDYDVSLFDSTQHMDDFINAIIEIYDENNKKAKEFSHQSDLLISRCSEALINKELSTEFVTKLRKLFSYIQSYRQVGSYYLINGCDELNNLLGIKIIRDGQQFQRMKDINDPLVYSQQDDTTAQDDGIIPQDNTSEDVSTSQTVITIAKESCSWYIGNIKVDKKHLSTIESYLNNNMFIKAVKYVREITALGLIPAEYFITHYHELNRNKPQNLPEENGRDGCYVATCVYGSYDCPQVWTLRRYRDYKLTSTWYGRAFIRIYYTISPILVKLLGNTKWFKKMWKHKLDKMVKKLENQGYDNTPYQDRGWKK